MYVRCLATVSGRTGGAKRSPSAARCSMLYYPLM